MENIIYDICNYIINNIENEITLEELEKEFYYNKYYIVRAFKEYTGNTIKEFINKIKVYKTIDPLVFTDDTILKIALTNGFNSQEYYSERFKTVIGTSPIKFRKEHNIYQEKDIEKLKLIKKELEKLKESERNLIEIGKVRKKAA